MNPNESNLISTVENLVKEVASIKSNTINRYLDNASKDIIKQIVTESLFDIFWQKLTHFITFFESLDGYDVNVSGGGAAAVGAASLQIDTAATNGNVAEVLKTPDAQGLLSFGFRSSFRTTASVSTSGGSLANTTAYYCIGEVGNENYGFKWASGNLLGFTSTGGTETTKTLVTTFGNATLYNLEARFFPTNRVDFYVNGTLKATSTSNLPTTANFALVHMKITAGENNGKTLLTSFFEYIQERNLTNFNY
mgnify:CR=1 FL=1